MLHSWFWSIVANGGVGIVVGIFLSWFIRRIWSRKKKGPIDLRLPIESEEYRLYEKWADQNGMTASEWARGVLKDSLPAHIREMAQREKKVAPSIEKAFEKLDEMEKAELGLKGEKETAPEPVAAAVPVHPCIFLKPGQAQNYRAGECSGECQSPGKTGSVCFWAPNAAKQCPDYVPKRFKTPKR